MRKRSLVLVLLVATAIGLPHAGCGGSGAVSPAGDARPGPHVFVLPFLPPGPGQLVFVGFKNLFNTAATVYVSAFAPGGGAYNVDGDTMAAGIQPLAQVVPANGELRVSLASLIAGGPAGGWLLVDTRDITALDATTGQPTPAATSGFVLPYIHRQSSGAVIEADSFEGVTGQTTGVTVSVLPETDSIQLVNYSFNEMAGGPVAPIAVTFTVSTFNTAGTLVGTTMVAVPPNGSMQFAPAVLTGSVRIAATGLPAPPAMPQTQQVRYVAVASENGLQTHAEYRFHETSLGHLATQVDVGFAVEFGVDDATNTHDFEVLMSNATGSNHTVLLQAVYRKGGLPILTTPRAFLLNAGRTVLMRTQTADSIGLNAGETSFFDDLFGDVFVATGFDEVTLWFQVPAAIDISARHYDPAFASFYRIVRLLPRTTVPCVYDLPIQDTLLTGTRNIVSITNTSVNEMRIPITGFTPGGTQYLLDPIMVPGRTRLDWTPDGLVFRENPTNPLLPPVPFMRFQFSPAGGVFCAGRTRVVDPLGLIRFVTPTANRDN
jgi:hypothetical protein